MKEKDMTNFEPYSNFNLKRYEKTFLKKICHFIKEPAIIGGLNGGVSGAIAAFLAVYGYIALPGFGPIIVMGVGVALSVGVITGIAIGSIIGIIVGTIFGFAGDFICRNN
ncbi:putative membrane protein [Bartonella australis AUST/NH1]|uniref:Putative membrane protein n=1 Tax=Bartonella australis (strain Aust/NH1) TaxID=1094489 RepID=M1N3Q8_BARAA|nr:hypothetical protein [Bartonella australis]AGF74534.1 putative membrane protein [Bartonella australis AUST/NH1]